MKKIISIALFLLSWPAIVCAKEVGQINAVFDGEERQWYVISVERGDQTVLTASLSNLKRLPSLSLQGHTTPRFSNADVLSINASWFGAYDPAKAPASVEIIFMPKGMSNPFYTSDQVPEAPELTIETMEFDDASGRAKGSFSGKVCLVPKLYEAPDLDNCKTISGTFDTGIQVR